MKDWIMGWFYYFAGFLSPQPFHKDGELKGYILRVIADNDFKSFVETGTYRGDSFKWMLDNTRLSAYYTLESRRSYNGIARLRFGSRALRGESEKLLPSLLPSLEEPILFWLDAHYGTVSPFPLREELDAIRTSGKRCFILVDDYDDPEIASDIEAPDCVLTINNIRSARPSHEVAVLDWLRLPPRTQGKPGPLSLGPD